jgi:hypothetical protein
MNHVELYWYLFCVVMHLYVAFDICFAVFRWLGIILVLVTPPNLFSLIAILIGTFNGKKARSRLKYLAHNYLVDKEI